MSASNGKRPPARRVAKLAADLLREPGKGNGKAGRPRGAKTAAILEIEAAAKLYAGDAIRTLVWVALKGKNESARIAAATALLDRGYGKPRQAVDLTLPLGGGVLAVPVAIDALQWAATAEAQQRLLLQRPAQAPLRGEVVEDGG